MACSARGSGIAPTIHGNWDILDGMVRSTHAPQRKAEFVHGLFFLDGFTLPYQIVQLEKGPSPDAEHVISPQFAGLVEEDADLFTETTHVSHPLSAASIHGDEIEAGVTHAAA